MTHRAICILAREASDLMVRYQACFAGIVDHPLRY
jgi:hypothetical protein